MTGILKIVSTGFTMPTTSIETQIRNLELQLQLQESNYRYALELQKDFEVLRRLRYNIKALKELLQSLKEYSAKAKHNFQASYIFKDNSINAFRKYASPPLRKKDLRLRNNREK